MSDTPITDALARSQHPTSELSTEREYGEQMFQHARKMERDRARLMEALRRIADETERKQLPITTMIHLSATDALESIEKES